MFLYSRKAILSLLLSFTVFFAKAQDTSWTVVKADHVFSVSMPRDFVKTDSTIKTAAGNLTYTMLELWGGNVMLRIIRGDTLRKARNQKDAFLSGVESELKESGRNLGYTPIFSDTIISNVKGIEGLLYKDDDVMKRAYCFFVEGKLYCAFYFRDDPKSQPHYDEFLRMLGSMHFSSPEATDTAEVPAYIPPVESSSNSSMAGEMIAALVLIVLITGLVIYLKFRN